jgi:hypothetical protein
MPNLLWDTVDKERLMGCASLGGDLPLDLHPGSYITMGQEEEGVRNTVPVLIWVLQVQQESV